MSTTVFEGGDNGGSPPVVEDKDWLEELVGEGKKYKDPQSLAKSRIEADNFIETLKRENADLRNQVKTSMSLQEFMDKMKNERPTPGGNQSATGGSQSNNQNSDGTPNKDEGAPNQPSLTPEQVEKIIAEREARKEAERNVNEVKRIMSEKWGSNYVSKLEQVIQETGIAREDLDALAQKSPKAFARFTGLDQATGQKQQNTDTNNNSLFTPPRTSINPDTNQSSTGEHTESWWNAMRKKDRALYYSDEMTKQRHRDAMRLGEKFFS